MSLMEFVTDPHIKYAIGSVALYFGLKAKIEPYANAYWWIFIVVGLLLIIDGKVIRSAL